MTVSPVYEDSKLAAAGKTRGRYCVTIKVERSVQTLRFNSREAADAKRDELKDAQ